MVGSISKIGQFFDHLNFEKYEPGCLYVGPIFRLKFSSKSGFVKLTLYSPPTSISILYLTSPTVTLTGGVKEGRLKTPPKTHINHSQQFVAGENEAEAYMTCEDVFEASGISPP